MIRTTYFHFRFSFRVSACARRLISLSTKPFPIMQMGTESICNRHLEYVSVDMPASATELVLKAKKWQLWIWAFLPILKGSKVQKNNEYCVLGRSLMWILDVIHHVKLRLSEKQPVQSALAQDQRGRNQTVASTGEAILSAAVVIPSYCYRLKVNNAVIQHRHISWWLRNNVTIGWMNLKTSSSSNWVVFSPRKRPLHPPTGAKPTNSGLNLSFYDEKSYRSVRTVTHCELFHFWWKRFFVVFSVEERRTRILGPVVLKPIIANPGLKLILWANRVWYTHGSNRSGCKYYSALVPWYTH